MNSKLKKFLKAVVVTLALIPPFYVAGLSALVGIAKRTSEPLETLAEAQEYLEKEKRKLGCNKKVNIRFEDDIMGAGANITIATGEYNIRLGTRSRNLNALQHELYHIHDGHVQDRKISMWEYVFYCEPKAVWYSLWN